MSTADLKLTGLAQWQAAESLEQDGPNELPRAEHRTALRIMRDLLREPMLAMLLAAGAIYLVLGDLAEGLTLLVFAGFSVAVTIVQEARTENALEALRDLSAPRAMVIRDGETRRIAGREIVKGDILVLNQGDRVPADAAVLEARDLEVDEALLTGESVPVSKHPSLHETADPNGPDADDQSRIFSGSIVTRGSGTARVEFTGVRTKIGTIGRSLATLETEASPLQQQSVLIVRLCALGGLIVALAAVLLYGWLRGGWLDAILSGIAIGMSLLPEEFPVVLAIFLAMGAWRIARGGVLTRRIAAVETLGAATVLCSDKTGTLTQNRMVVASLWLPSGASISADAVPLDPGFHRLLDTGALACAPIPIDPMEIAFHEAARGTATTDRRKWILVHTHDLRSDLLAVSNIWRLPGDEATLKITAKGAPEAISRLCRLPDDERNLMEEAVQGLAAQGMRVLGVAAGTLAADEIGKPHEDHAFEFLGLVGLADPLRAGVREAIEQCHRAGIRVVMITGDHPATAKAIAEQAGIRRGVCVTGDQMTALSDNELAGLVPSVTIFARIQPEQKLRIVTALIAIGEIVAMTGDGVNDAPALKAAHIGIAMGKRGTDVAREAAAIVLVDDDFGAILGAIGTGRRIYDNIRKAVGFIFAVHVPIAGLAIMPLLLGLPIILGPIQIALIEMIIDPICALAFEAEREEANLMRRPPRDPRRRLFSASLATRSILQGGIALTVLSVAFVLGAHFGTPEHELRALSFFMLVAAILALVMSNRTSGASLRSALSWRNRSLSYILVFTFAGSALILTIPALQEILHFAPLSLAQLSIVMVTGAMLLLLFELTKSLKRFPACWMGMRPIRSACG